MLAGAVLGGQLAAAQTGPSAGEPRQPPSPAAGAQAGGDKAAPEKPRGLLRRPTDPPVSPLDPRTAMEDPTALFRTPVDPPLGFTGPSGIVPREVQQNSHFVPVEDRWRIGFPEWDRYGKGHPPVDDYPYVLGRWWDPFNQNVFKGDYPILGQHIFLDITATSLSLFEARQVPTPNTPFESTVDPFKEAFFGSPDQFFFNQYLKLSFDLFHGDAAFKPFDWRIRLTPVFNVNYLALEELGIVNPDVRKGTTRGRTFFALEEWYAEAKLADVSPNYDFISVRAGSQYFNSDFRGFLFNDTNRAVRLFGNRNANRDQWNMIFFDQQEKDTNSGLNNIVKDRHQQVFIANYYRQDFIWPGYTAQASIHYNHDKPSFLFDRNNFLVRPDPAGVFKPHRINSVYLGWTGDGHIDRYNISHALYWALGRDSLNPIANQKQDINAQFAALELSYDRDWIRFRTSTLWASGDGNVNNSHATGFDTILDNPNFAGGEFSYWQRQSVKLFGVNLVNRNSLVNDLRSSKTQGQSNFVNPGLFLINFGVDLDLTPKLRIVNNVNVLWFDKTNVLEQFVFQSNIDRHIGTDLSMGVEYRPLLSNNIIMTFGLATLVPGHGFEDLYNNPRTRVPPLVSSFLELNLTY